MKRQLHFWKKGPLSILMVLSMFYASAQCVCTDCRCADSLELVKLYNSTNGANWANKWILTQPMITWQGLTLNTSGRVTRIDLNSNNLRGTIPNLNVPNLRYWDMSRNQLVGAIPNLNLPNLTVLALFTNQLSGNIPNLNLLNLTQLYLNDNQLTGITPNFSLPNLILLHLYNNQLNGTIPNFNLPQLEQLFLDFNQFTGAIPNFNLPLLEQLYLDGNQLSGCIPRGIKTQCPLITATGGSIGNNPNLATQSWANYWNNGQGACVLCTSMTNTMNITGGNVCQGGTALLAAGTNAVAPTYLWSTGETTSSISITRAGTYSVTISQSDGCTKNTSITAGVCAVIDTNSCRYKDSLELVRFNRLTGGTSWTTKWDTTQPLLLPNGNPNIQYWKGVTQDVNGCVIGVILTKNNLQGNVPNLNLPKLEELTLDSNFLTGAIPNFNLPELKVLNLQKNLLTDKIPYFNLPNLEQLILHDNQLRDTIPNFYLPKLVGLYIGNNLLSGQIPSFNLPNLQELYAYTNAFTISTLPNFDLLELVKLDFSACQLNTTLTNFTRLPKLRYLQLYDNQLSGQIPSFNCSKLELFELHSNRLSGQLPELNFPLLLKIKVHNNQLTGCFPASYQSFCRIPIPANRNFSNNIGLPNNGDFAAFCNNSTGICRDTTSCRYQDSFRLIALYRATNGAAWAPRNALIDGVRKISPWNLNQPISTWYGVRMNSNGCVYGLDLDGIDSDGGEDASGMNMSGALPDSLFEMSRLELLYMNGNRITNLPNSIGRARRLRELQFINNGMTILPDSLWTLTNLEGLVLNKNPLNQALPNAIGGLRNILRLHFAYCGLKLALPETVANLTNLRFLDIRNNQIDSFPDISRLPLSVPRLPYFFLQNNKLTFDDVLKNRAHFVYDSFVYAPQADFFTATTINATIGNTVTIDLGIDKGIPDNNYRWFKNGVEVPSLFSQKSVFILRGPLPCDAGVYTCEVTNLRAPNLILKSNPITINVNPIVPQTRNKTICFGQKDTLPSGQIVAPIASATYRETLRNSVNTCDSAIITTNLTVIPLAVVNKIDSFCEGYSYTLMQRSTNDVVRIAGVYDDTLTAANGCKTRYTTTLTYRSNLTRTERISLCTGGKYILPNGNTVYTEGSYISRKTTSGCDSIITTTVTVNQKPTAQIVGLTPFYCRDNTAVTLQGQPTGGTFKIDGATALNLNLSALSVGNHTVSYIFRAANGCSDTAIQAVRLGDLGRNTISRVMCAGDSVTIRGKVYHQRNLTGTDVLTAAATSGCDSIITIQVGLHQKVKAIDDNIEVLINTGTVLIDVLQNDIYPANLYDIKLLKVPNIGKIEELNNDKFKLTIPNSVSTDIVFTYQLCHLNCVNDCTTATVRVKITDKRDELDPIVTGITPNGDGKNEKFDLPQLDWSKYPESTLEIFNRWGQKLYVSAPYKRDWEGHDNDGRELPNGDYFFILSLNRADRKIIVGSVYLAR